MVKIAAGLDALRVPIDSLTLDARNPRQGDVAAVARSLDRFGQRKPIVFKVDGDERVVIAGNHTVLAARDTLGWTEIAAVDASDLTDEEARAYALADNRTSDLATYDPGVLAELLAELPTSLVAATAWTDDEIAGLDHLIQMDQLISQQDPHEEWDANGLVPYTPKSFASAYVAHFHFATEDDADAFFALIDRPRHKVTYWPERPPGLPAGAESYAHKMVPADSEES